MMTGALPAADHDERRVPLDETTIKSNKYGADATLSLKGDGGLMLKIQMNGKPVVIPENLLAPIRNADFGTVAFSTETPTGVPVSEWKLKGGLILSFYFGDKVTQGSRKGRQEGVVSACRIKISADGNLDRIETAVPQGNDSFNWRVIFRSKGAAILRCETVESHSCPLSMRWKQ
mgnify:FL=1